MDDLSAITQADTANNISMVVAKKALDSEKEQGDAMVELIRQAGAPAPNHEGGLDLYA